MRASLIVRILGLLLLAPFSAAHAQGPALSPIANVTMNAGGTLHVSVIAVDGQNRPIALTAALPPFATLENPTVGTGVVVTSITLAPSAAQVGDYTAAVTATAGGVPTVRVFAITVNAAGSDRAPLVVAPPLAEVTAGSPLAFGVNASDPDGDAIANLGVTGLPAGATFTPDGTNTSAAFAWTPGAGDVGEYDVTFTATNALAGSSLTHVRVTAAPTLGITPIDDVTLAGGTFASVPVHASGVPGAAIVLTAALPSFATLDPPGTGTGAVNTTVTLSPPSGSAGTYHASITATSLGESVTEPFDIIVTGASGGNRAPVVAAPETASVAVGATLTFDVTATDPDGDHVDLSGSALPPGSNFIDHANDTGSFSWTPVSGQAGIYTASFTGLDNRGGSGSASTIITVVGGVVENHPPVVSAPATEQVDEAAHLSFTVTATDPDGDHVALSVTGLPTGASFADHGDNSGTFAWTPDTTQSGTYDVAFQGDDGHGGSETAHTMITVHDLIVVSENHPPVLSAPAMEQVDEGAHLSFTVTATDPDGDHVALSVTGLPTGASFADHGDNSGTFAWTPDTTQSGSYDVAFQGDDGHGGSGAAHTMIVVHDVIVTPPAPDTGTVAARACVIGPFKAKSDSTCFRFEAVKHSFALKDVVLGSIRLRYHGATIAAMYDGRIETTCGSKDDVHHKDGDGDDDDDHHKDKGKDKHKDLQGAIYSDESHHHGHGGDGDGDDDDKGKGKGKGDDDDDDACNLSCPADPGHHGDGDDDDDDRGASCDTLGIRASFATDALIQLFAQNTAEGGHDDGDDDKDDHKDHHKAKHALPCALVDAEILATLTNGSTVVATFGDRDDDKDKDKDKHKDEHKDGDDDHHKVCDGKRQNLRASVIRSSLAPESQLAFTTSQQGVVRVAVYDMQGRLVKRLLNEYRASGSQTVAWDGTSDANLRVVSGVYFVRILAPEGAVTSRITVVR